MSSNNNYILLNIISSKKNLLSVFMKSTVLKKEKINFFYKNNSLFLSIRFQPDEYLLLKNSLFNLFNENEVYFSIIFIKYKKSYFSFEHFSQILNFNSLKLSKKLDQDEDDDEDDNQDEDDDEDDNQDDEDDNQDDEDDNQDEDDEHSKVDVANFYNDTVICYDFFLFINFSLLNILLFNRINSFLFINIIFSFNNLNKCRLFIKQLQN